MKYNLYCIRQVLLTLENNLNIAMNMFSKLSLLSFLFSIHIEERKRTQTANGSTCDLPVLIIALIALAVGVIGLFIALKALHEAQIANKNRDLSEFAAAFETLEPSDKEKVMKYIEEIKDKRNKPRS